jgi:hypothetical protein
MSVIFKKSLGCIQVKRLDLLPTCEKYPESDGPVDHSQDTQKDDKCQDPKGCVRIRVNIRMPEKQEKIKFFAVMLYKWVI